MPTMIKHKITLFICFFLLSATFIDTGSHIHFRRITISDGLSLSSVYCIFQDSKGFMWFGTEDGLNKYDGRNFRIFRPDPLNKNSISNRWIEEIYEDFTGNLWFGSRGGLTVFNPITENFFRFRHSPSDQTSLSNDTITIVLQTDPESIWIGTLQGLNRINPETNHIDRISQQEENLKGLESRINDLLPDGSGNLWIGTNMGLFFYDTEHGSFSLVCPESGLKDRRILSLAMDENDLWIGASDGLYKYILNNKAIRYFPVNGSRRNPDNARALQKVYLDRNQNMWAITMEGLYMFDQEKESFTLIVRAEDISHSLSINAGKPFLGDSYGYLWYGTFGSGLYRIDPISGNIHNYQNNTADLQSLSENSINCIYEDRSGVLWFGTFGAGISIYDPKSHEFDLITHDPVEENSLSSNFVWSVFEDLDGSVWIGTNDKGLNRYFTDTDSFAFFDYNPQDPTSLANSSVREIFQDSNGTLWIGTDGGGLCRMDTETGKFTRYASIPGDTTSLSDNSVRVIYEDHSGFLWIGTREGLNRFDPRSQIFRQYFHSDDDPGSISNNFIYSVIYEDSNGYLWIGTYGGGLNKMNIQNETFISYIHDPEDRESIADNVVFSIYEDSTGILWIGTNNGLNRFIPSSEKFKFFGVNEGLPNEVIYGILPDEMNNIWLSTNLGISRFSLSDYSVKNFDASDGLQSNEFNGGAFHKGNSGRLYFAGVYGLNIIDPGKITADENNSEIVITKLEILGKEVGILPQPTWNEITPRRNRLVEIDDNFYLYENISFADEIVLDYKHRSLSIEFSALNNRFPDKVRYAYMMENLDEDWNYSSNRNFVSYANMKSGTYLFTVNSENPDGIWSDSPAHLRIVITPPFWKTWWFIILEIALASLFIYFVSKYFVKVRTNKLLRIQNQQINVANARLAESEANLKELNATKDKFFSIISHDLKNPLTSLISISELMLPDQNKPAGEEKDSGIYKIHESIKHIYELLENLLTWSRSQTGRLNFEPVNFSLSTVIDVNINLHRIPSEKKRIKLVSEADKDLIAFGDHDMVNTIVRNLLNNAVKFTDQGGTITVTGRKKGEFLELLVKDQGVGLSEEDLNKLFRIEVKMKSKGTRGEKGTGLGLILCKEFVEKNGGKMIAKSILHKGSEFGFTIPTGKSD